MAANEREAEILQAIDDAAKHSRRAFLGTAAAAAAGVTVLSSQTALTAKNPRRRRG